MTPRSRDGRVVYKHLNHMVTEYMDGAHCVINRFYESILGPEENAEGTPKALRIVYIAFLLLVLGKLGVNMIGFFLCSAVHEIK